MPIYKIVSGDTLSQIAQKQGTTVAALMAANPSITDPNKIYAGQSLNLPALTPTPTPVAPAAQLTPTQTQSIQQQITAAQQQVAQLTPQVQAFTQAQQAGMAVSPTTTLQEAQAFTAGQIQAGQVAPTLPAPTAPTIQDQYTQSMLATLTQQRTAVEQTYQTQLENAKRQAEAAQAKIDQLTTQYKDTLEQARPLMEPFRETLEKAERERLKVEENYFANQTLTNELGTLLTDIQASLQRERDITGLAAIREPRIAQAKEDAMARVGVIEAVMAARNNQISVAYSLIDRTSNAIAADRNDKINYYNTLLNFYGKQRDEEGAKLLALTAEQKGWIAAQIGLLESDLKTSQANAEYIKTLLISPESAGFMASAGVNLNMTPQQVNQALAEETTRREIEATKNNYIAQGFEFVPFPQAGQDLMTISVGGQSLAFKRPPEAPTAPITDIPTSELFQGARDIVLGMPNATENEMVNAIRAKYPTLPVGDAQRIAREAIEVREGGATLQEIAGIKQTLKPMIEAGIKQEGKTTREQDEVEALRGLEKQFEVGLGKLPETYKKAVAGIMDEIYADETFGEPQTLTEFMGAKGIIPGIWAWFSR